MQPSPLARRGREIMTDRYKGLVVTLERDVRSDDAQPIIDAIKQIRGVLSVAPSVVCIDDHMNRARIAEDFIAKLYKVLREGNDND